VGGRKVYSGKNYGIVYLSSPSIFLQSNPFACAKLYSEVKQAVVSCGGGGVWICIAEAEDYFATGGRAGKITAVDSSARNIEDAGENAKLNGINNIDFFVRRGSFFCRGSSLMISLF